MKKYRKPELETEIIMDVNEAVYMACSGKTWFTNIAVDYQHQEPEQGRLDSRFQVDCDIVGPTGDPYEGDVYLYYVFPRANVVVVNGGGDWQKVSTWQNGNYTYWIGKRTYKVQAGNSIGYGDLIAYVNEEPYETVVPDPTVAFSLVNDNSCF